MSAMLLFQSLNSKAKSKEKSSRLFCFGLRKVRIKTNLQIGISAKGLANRRLPRKGTLTFSKCPPCVFRYRWETPKSTRYTMELAGLSSSFEPIKMFSGFRSECR